jgi:hypothetical protein
MAKITVFALLPHSPIGYPEREQELRKTFLLCYIQYLKILEQSTQ